MAKTKKDSLKTYKKRRNLKASGEPGGATKVKKLQHPIFVIQKHDASHLHYDFRIEMDGVLKSWAVPKGISTTQKHLAMPTDDHPMDYATFEGIIPEGNYGAGTVMVWDLGTYENIKEKNGKPVSMDKCYQDGQIEIRLYGKKLYGDYALIKTSRGWLIMKIHGRQRRPASEGKKVAASKSVLTGRTLKQIADDAGSKKWKSNKKKSKTAHESVLEKLFS